MAYNILRIKNLTEGNFAKHSKAFYPLLDEVALVLRFPIKLYAPYVLP